MTSLRTTYRTLEVDTSDQPIPMSPGSSDGTGSLTASPSASLSDPPPSNPIQSNTSYDEKTDSRRPWFSLFLNFASLMVYSYAIYHQNYDSRASIFFTLLDPKVKPYGLWIFLTYHSIIIQNLSSLLHIATHAFPRLRIIRDILFTCFAYPIGSLVAYSFWTIWLTLGREMIFPIKFEPFYPCWLNHVSHTILVPINLAQCYLTYHRTTRRGYLLPLLYVNIYGVTTLLFRWKVGHFNYPFLNEMSPISMAIYWISNSFCIMALYETRSYITALLHTSKLRRYIE